jgi:hypothetical protein
MQKGVARSMSVSRARFRGLPDDGLNAHRSSGNRPPQIKAVLRRFYVDFTGAEWSSRYDSGG